MVQLKDAKRDENENKARVVTTKRQLIPPEGGYGWFIVLAYAIANVSTDQTAHASNECYVEWKKIEKYHYFSK